MSVRRGLNEVFKTLLISTIKSLSDKSLSNTRLFVKIGLRPVLKGRSIGILRIENFRLKVYLKNLKFQESYSLKIVIR